MRAIIFMLMLVGGFTSQCSAEPRWCSVAGKDLSNKFIYPPIARAARVSGVVLSRMIYSPSGKVLEVQPVSGPRLLSNLLTAQLIEWTVKTNVPGDELCQTLVIAEFRLHDSYAAPPVPVPQPEPPSILRLLAEADPIPTEVVISDPGPLRGWTALRVKFGYRLRRVFGVRR